MTWSNARYPGSSLVETVANAATSHAVVRRFAGLAASGHDVYCYYMMKGLAEQGALSHCYGVPTAPEAVEGVKLALCGQLPMIHRSSDQTDVAPGTLPIILGNEPRPDSVRPGNGEKLRADVVIAFACPPLPYLAGVENRFVCGRWRTNGSITT